ncbi:MAG: hypothetical protein ACP5HX_11015 [Thermoproteota archaeon]
MSGERKEMVILDPSKIADKQVKRATDPTTEEFYKAAMQALTVNPAELSAQAEDKWFNKLEKVHKDGTRKAIMSKIKKEDIVGPAVEFGGENLRKQIEKRKNKIQNFWSRWAPKLKAHVDNINKLPDVTDEDREKRMIENLRGLKKLKGTWRT